MKHTAGRNFFNFCVCTSTFYVKFFVAVSEGSCKARGAELKTTYRYIVRSTSTRLLLVIEGRIGPSSGWTRLMHGSVLLN